MSTKEISQALAEYFATQPVTKAWFFGSYARGEHSTFPLSGVIEGFREGVMLMPMGSHYIFYIHPDLGYGDRATGSMDPNSLLIFNVETYSIVKGE